MTGRRGRDRALIARLLRELVESSRDGRVVLGRALAADLLAEIEDDQLGLFEAPQPPLSSVLAEEAAGREEGMARAARRAGEEWNCRARETIRAVALRLVTFTSDDVWEAGLEKPDGADARALGAHFAALARSGLIRKTGRYLPSRQKGLHMTPIAEWQLARRA